MKIIIIPIYNKKNSYFVIKVTKKFLNIINKYNQIVNDLCHDENTILSYDINLSLTLFSIEKINYVLILNNSNEILKNTFNIIEITYKTWNRIKNDDCDSETMSVHIYTSMFNISAIVDDEIIESYGVPYTNLIQKQHEI
jgi:hypothetical protein